MIDTNDLSQADRNRLQYIRGYAMSTLLNMLDVDSLRLDELGRDLPLDEVRDLIAAELKQAVEDLRDDMVLIVAERRR